MTIVIVSCGRTGHHPLVKPFRDTEGHPSPPTFSIGGLTMIQKRYPKLVVPLMFLILILAVYVASGWKIIPTLITAGVFILIIVFGIVAQRVYFPPGEQPKVVSSGVKGWFISLPKRLYFLLIDPRFLIPVIIIVVILLFFNRK